jgi:hypothetical protein
LRTRRAGRNRCQNDGIIVALLVVMRQWAALVFIPDIDFFKLL